MDELPYLRNAIHDWLCRVVASEAPPSSIVAFNIGLFETPDGYSAYLAGCESYDPANDDWATMEAFTPKERYLHWSRVQCTGADWEVVLAEVL